MSLIPWPWNPYKSQIWDVSEQQLWFPMDSVQNSKNITDYDVPDEKWRVQEPKYCDQSNQNKDISLN